jgi:hypothetical protein
MNDVSIIIKKGKNVVLHGKRDSSGLFVLSSHMPLRVGSNMATRESSVEKLRMIHNRLGHLNARSIKQMVESKMVDGIPLTDIETTELNCPHCVAGKSAKLPYPSNKSRPPISADLNIGDELHTDHLGPISPVSRYGNKYIIEFIDGASRLAFIFGMKSLDETFDRYSDLRNLVATQKGIKFKLLICDGHSTYTSNKMVSLLRSDGTIQKIRAPYEPNQNPIAERRIRTNVEMARTMMIHAGAPAYTWEDAIAHANYIRNRVITRVIPNMTPYEKFWGRKPNLEYVKPFGCLAYVIIHKELRESKFEASATPGIFIGISDRHSAYKIELMCDKTVKVARDVRFYEDVFPYRQNPSNDLQWLNPMDLPTVQHEADEALDPLNEIRKMTAEEELRKVYERIPVYSDIPNAGIKRDRKLSAKIDAIPKVALMENISNIEIDSVVDGFALNIGQIEPKNITEALNGPNADEWRKACELEFGAIHKTGTFARISPEAQKLLDEGRINVHGTRSILKIKLDENGKIARHKVRVVIQGFTMQQGVDFDSSFAPCARMATIRLLTALAVQNKWELLHGDVPNAYLNGKTQKLVLVRLPKHWNEVMGQELGNDGDPVICVKSLYGAPDAGHNWNSCQHDAFIEQGYTQSTKEPCIYSKITDCGICIFGIWVDDNFVTGSDLSERDRMIEVLKKKFNIKMLGRLSFALGISFKWSDDSLKMTQSAYIERIAKKYRLSEANPCNMPLQKGFRPQSSMCPKSEHDTKEMNGIPYREAIGSLLYVAICTRPDISYAVCSLARFCNNPGREHWAAVKQIIKYIYTTKNMGIVHAHSQDRSPNGIPIVGYHDAAYNDSDTGKSTLGHIVFVGGCPVSWRSKLSTGVPQSAMEAELMSMNGVVREIQWVMFVCESLLGVNNKNALVLSDNNAAIQSATVHRVTERNKHIRPQYFYVVDLVSQGCITIQKVSSEDQVADALTKALGNPQFSRLRELMRVG